MMMFFRAMTACRRKSLKRPARYVSHSSSSCAEEEVLVAAHAVWKIPFPPDHQDWKSTEEGLRIVMLTVSLMVAGG